MNKIFLGCVYSQDITKEQYWKLAEQMSEICTQASMFTAYDPQGFKLVLGRMFHEAQSVFLIRE